MSRFRRRLMGLAAMRKTLADDYVRVEYIENTSTAYIDTKLFTVYDDGRTYKHIVNLSYTVTNERQLNGANGTGYFGINKNGNFECACIQDSAIAAGDSWHNINFSYYNPTNTSLNVKYEIDNQLLERNPSKVNLYNYPYAIYIFAIGGRNGAAPSFFCKERIKSYQIYIADELVRDYIPMYQISTDTYGLWDRVEKKFYTSPNGVKFIGGHQIIYDAEIEYLRGTDPQYIDTGIIPNKSTGVYAVGYKFDGLDNFMLGCRNDNSNTRWAIGKSEAGWYYGWGTYNNSGIQGNPAYIYMNYMNDRLFKVTTPKKTKTMTLPRLSFTPIHNIRLFGSAGVNANYTKWNGAIYKVTITQGTEIIMDLIPVRVGNVGYMYDKVSNKLFGNDGSGSFILGQDTVVYDKI